MINTVTMLKEHCWRLIESQYPAVQSQERDELEEILSNFSRIPINTLNALSRLFDRMLADKYFEVFGQFNCVLLKNFFKVLSLRLQGRDSVALKHILPCGVLAIYITQKLQALTDHYILYRSQQTNIDSVEHRQQQMVYHNAGHFAEMVSDATLMLQEAAIELFDNKEQMHLYIALMQAMHAVHDIVQYRGAPVNEIDSYGVFIKDLFDILSEATVQSTLNQQHIQELQAVLQITAYEVIVTSTVFNFAQKRSMLEGLEQYLEPDTFQITDPAVFLGAWSAAIHDTKRMTQLEKMMQLHSQRLAEQYHRCGGSKNRVIRGIIKQCMPEQILEGQVMDRLFQSKVIADHAQTDYYHRVLQFLHMYGQNFRMGVCELGQQGASLPEVQAFIAYLLDYTSDSEKKLQICLGDETFVQQAFDFILNKFLTQELKFSVGFEWFNADQVAQINDRARGLHPFTQDIVNASNVAAWETYRKDTEHLLQTMQTKCTCINKKRDFIYGTLKIAKQQEGLQLVEQKKLEVARQLATEFDGAPIVMCCQRTVSEPVTVVGFKRETNKHHTNKRLITG